MISGFDVVTIALVPQGCFAAGCVLREDTRAIIREWFNIDEAIIPFTLELLGLKVAQMQEEMDALADRIERIEDDHA